MITGWRLAAARTSCLLLVLGATQLQAASSVPDEDAFLSRETSAYEALKSKNEKFWKSFLSDRFIGWGSSGRLDKAAAIKEYTDCKISDYKISDVQKTPLGADAALITHKVVINGVCGGEEIPQASWAATAYVRDGNEWKAAFHAEAAIVDPAAPKKTAQNSGGEHRQRVLAPRDPHTGILLLLERAIWDAWKDRDPRRLDGLTASSMQFINIFGIHLATKADALQNWSGEGCEVNSVQLSDAGATMLTPNVGILTFSASADGVCFGQRPGPIWGSSVYVKQGDTWKWNFGINLPARLEGG